MQVTIREAEFAYGPGAFALRVPELEIDAGERIACIGPSGSGKTTLLRLLAGIYIPRTGTVTVGEHTIHDFTDIGRRDYRIQNVGFIFQDFRLIDYLNVRENMLLPWRISAALTLDEGVHTHLQSIAEALDLTSHLEAAIDTLSQGEQQRAAIGRALLPQPGLLLADEPTGNLDPANKDRILDLLFEQAAESKATLVMVTHDHALLDRFDRVIDFAQFLVTEDAHA